MLRIKSEPIDDSDFDSDSDEDVSKDESDYELKYDVDSSKDFDVNDEALTSSAKIIEPKSVPEGKNVKAVLAETIRGFKRYKKPYNLGVKKVPWDCISIDGYSTEDLKKELQEIINVVDHSRKLDELLAEYLKHETQYNKKRHPDYPKRPGTAYWMYFKANREELTKLAEESNNGKPVSYKYVMQFGTEKFKNLPEKERANYTNVFKEKTEEFQLKLAEFYDKHPEILKRTQIIEMEQKERREKKKNKVKPVKALTPFRHFRDEMLKGGNTTSYGVLRRMWHEMSKEEKGKYIAEVAKMETDREKKIMKNELKILDLEMGVPPRPLKLYAYFMQRFKDSYAGSNSYAKDGAAAFKALSDEERERINNECKERLQKWKHELHAYILTLPKEQQMLMMQKHNLYSFVEKQLQREKKLKKLLKQKVKKKEKKSHDSDSNSKLVKIETTTKSEPLTSKNAESSPKTAKHDSDDEIDKSRKKKARKPITPDDDRDEQPTKKKPRQADPSDQEERGLSPKKKNISTKAIETSPEKSGTKIKENVLKSPPKKPKVREPEFPSQTTAHYFMTKIHEGTPNKTAKAYKKLDRQVKGKYRTEMRKSRQEFLQKMSTFIKTLQPFEVAAYQAKIEALKAEQTKQIEWHIDQGTNTASSNSS